MGFAPPVDGPPPGDVGASGSTCIGGLTLGAAAGASADVGFTKLHLATICGFSLDIPIPTFTFELFLSLLFDFVFKFDFHISFKLSCDLSNPIDISAGLDWGAGRCPNVPPDPDDNEYAS